MRVIVDTCVWSQFLRRGQPAQDPVRVELEKLIRADAVQMLGAIRQELLSGARPEERFAQLKEYLRFYPNLLLDEVDDENAARYYNICRKNGVQGAATDLLICAASVRHGFKIFTIDTDFDKYSECLPIKRHRYRNQPGICP